MVRYGPEDGVVDFGVGRRLGGFVVGDVLAGAPARTGTPPGRGAVLVGVAPGPAVLAGGVSTADGSGTGGGSGGSAPGLGTATP